MAIMYQHPRNQRNRPSRFSDALEWRSPLHKAGVLEGVAEAYADILAWNRAVPGAAFLVSIELQQGQAVSRRGYRQARINGRSTGEFCKTLEIISSENRQMRLAEISGMELIFATADRVGTFIRPFPISRKYDAALALTESVLRLTPSAVEVWRLRVLPLVDRGSLPDAIIGFRRNARGFVR
jgi:hypothetical protein